MPVELSAVFVLFELEGLTMAEIAPLLSLAPGTVASRLRRAREDFRDRARRVRDATAQGKGGPR
jgi:RNA polymerase sigma-70 factor (ECF subfamily)